MLVVWLVLDENPDLDLSVPISARRGVIDVDPSCNPLNVQGF